VKFVRATVFTTMLLIGALFVGSMTQAQASYIDPGATSYLFQMAIAGFFGVLYTARQVFRRINMRKEDKKQ
jgi:hypothetical protein